MTGSNQPAIMRRGAAGLREALAARVVVADGAMGTMLQGSDATLEDFGGYEGCNEILNVTRPDLVRSIYDGYLAAGADCISTNSFGANLGNLGEYGIADRIEELSETGARLARQAADAAEAADSRPRWVLGSMGPGTKLPTLGHVTFAGLRDAYQQNAAALLRGGADALVVETCQDMLQAKAALIGARRAISEAGTDAVLIASVMIETTGAMLLGTEIGAALTALEPLGIDLIGLNCATGPSEMSEHLRYLAAHARIPLTCMPNAGLPELTADGAYYPVGPEELTDALEVFADEFGLALAGGCCGTTPEHVAALAGRLGGGRPRPERSPQPEPGLASLYQHVPFRQDTAFLAVGERTNANGSRAFREAMLAGRYDECVEIARAQTRDGAHVLDVNVDYVGRDGAADMREVVSRLSTAVTLPLMLDSTEPPVIQAGLELLGGRSVVNSVNYEDGDGPDSRIARMMPLVREHGAAVVALTIDEQGQARTAEWKLAVATRLIEDLTGNWGMDVGDIIVDCLTFPVSTGQEETRRDALETINAIRELKRRYPDVQTTLGVSNVSFGLNPAARAVLNSVFLAEAVDAGLDSAIVHASRIMPIARIPDEQREAALDLVWDRRRPGYDPLSRLLELFEGATAASVRESRAQELARLPLWERLARRIIDGERNGLEADLDAGLAQRPALEIVNDVLLGRHEDGRRPVRLGPDAAAVRAPVRRGHEGRGELPRAAHGAVRGRGQGPDRAGHGQGRRARHRQEPGRHHPVQQRLRRREHRHQAAHLGHPRGRHRARRGRDRDVRAAGQVHRGDARQPGRAELPQAGRPVAGAARRGRAHPRLRGAGPGRHVRRRGQVRPRRVRGAAADGRVHGGQARPGRRAAARAAAAPGQRGHPPRPGRRRPGPGRPARSDVSATVPVPEPPFWGTRVVKGIPLADYAAYLDERALFLGQWGLKPTRGGSGPSHQELAETAGPPAAADVAGAGADRGPAAGRRGARLLPVLQRGQRARRAGRERPAAGTVPVPAAAPRPAAVPGRLLPAQRTPGRPTWWPSSWSRSARGSARRPPSCSPRTPTATTWSCTACPCSWPRRWRSTGTRGCATRWASAAPTRPTWTRS